MKQSYILDSTWENQLSMTRNHVRRDIYPLYVSNMLPGSSRLFFRRPSWVPTSSREFSLCYEHHAKSSRKFLGEILALSREVRKFMTLARRVSCQKFVPWLESHLAAPLIELGCILPRQYSPSAACWRYWFVYTDWSGSSPVPAGIREIRN